MFKKNVFLFVCLLIFSCNEKSKIVIPDTILSKEKMTAVMMDIQLVEASLNMTGINVKSSSIPNSSTHYLIDVFGKNKIDKKQFDNSYAFYTANPELLAEVYQLMLNDLSKMQAEATKKK